MSDDADRITLATELTVAWLANPNTRVSTGDVSAFLASVHDRLGELSRATAASTVGSAPEVYTPAVSVRKSLASPNRIVSMIDGKPYASLKRHLAAHGLTPDQYRDRYGLKPDYPMVAPGYSEARRDTAKRLGLGRKGTGSEVGSPSEPGKTSVAIDEPAVKTPSRKRLSIAGAKAAAKEHLGGADNASSARETSENKEG